VVAVPGTGTLSSLGAATALGSPYRGAGGASVSRPCRSRQAGHSPWGASPGSLAPHIGQRSSPVIVTPRGYGTRTWGPSGGGPGVTIRSVARAAPLLSRRSRRPAG